MATIAHSAPLSPSGCGSRASSWSFSSSPSLPSHVSTCGGLYYFGASLSPRKLGLSRRSIVKAGAGSLWTSIGLSGALVSAAGAAMAASMVTGRSKAQEASLAVKRGMELFIQGNVQGSLVEFDRALELDPRQKPYLWQRGLSLYYLDRFGEGAAQFREDVAVNPSDTEEAIWCFLCEAKLFGVNEARKRFLEVGPDRRPVMQTAYQLFRYGGQPEDLRNQFADGQEFEVFYADLYTGLYLEAEENEDAAKSAITAACRSRYGLRSGDYMAMLAKVHCKCRNWEL